jgi:hypothetical protein
VVLVVLERLLMQKVQPDQIPFFQQLRLKVAAVAVVQLLLQVLLVVQAVVLVGRVQVQHQVVLALLIKVTQVAHLTPIYTTAVLVVVEQVQ